MHASPELADIAASLLLALFPDRQLYRGLAGTGLHQPASLSMLPGLDATGFARLKEYLHQLVDRTEWRRRHALAREVSDRRGTFVELIVPVAPGSYSGGPAVVGPFLDETAADEFGSRQAGPALAHDAFPTAGGWLVDLFEVPAPGWESEPR